MAIRLDHLIVPSHHPVASAESLATLLDVPWEFQEAVATASRAAVLRCFQRM